MARVGHDFGKYRIVKLLGKGGMGEVYEAFDTSKDRTVALKILPDQYSHDERFRARFQRESHAAAVLQEPHVIPIHDWGEIEGHLYIDMRLVPGRTLHELIASGPLDPERAVTIIGQVAEALDAAHHAGLIHRDVKPQNVMITPTDFAYLVDFGIAEAHGEGHLTMTGTQVGSMAYMAPERFGTDATTSSVDVYALACVLCEMLTGRQPFGTDSLQQVIGAHLSTPPPRPSSTNPKSPAALDDVVARGMAKHPDDRYGSAGAFARAARRALGGSAPRTAVEASANATPTMERPHSPATIAAAAAPTSAATPTPTPARTPSTGTEPAAPQPKSPKWVVPAVIGAVGALLLAGIGVGIGMLATNQNNSVTISAPRTPGYTPPPADAPQTPTPQPSPPAAPAPQAAGSPPPIVQGPDNSTRHDTCNDGFQRSNASGFGSRSGRGSPETSCFFARSVLDTYWNDFGGTSRDLRTISTPGILSCGSVSGAICDGSNFVVRCAVYGQDNWITCTGGINARVYLY